MTERQLTTGEAARYLSLSKSGLQKHIRNGKIKPVGMTGPHSGRRHSPAYLFNILDLDELRKILDPKKRKPNTPTEDEVTEYGSTIHWSTKYRKPTKVSPGATEEYVMITCLCGDTSDVETYEFRRKGQPRLPLCRNCAVWASRRHGKYHQNWKGGFKISEEGYHYTFTKTLPEEERVKFGSMFLSTNYVATHRLVMARHLDRSLEEYEHVHHVDGDGLNNNVTNLVLHNQKGHTRTHKEQLRQTLYYQKQVELLGEQNLRLVLLVGFLLNQKD